MKKRLILIAVIILALILTGCNKEPNKATASYEYDDFTISLEQIVNSDDEIQVDVTLTLPARVTWGNLLDDPIPDDEVDSIVIMTHAYHLFQHHMTEADLQGRTYDEIHNDKAYMVQYSGVEYFPAFRTGGVEYTTNTVKGTFLIPIEKVDVNNSKMSLVLPFYEARYMSVGNEDIILNTFEGPFILNWEAVYE